MDYTIVQGPNKAAVIQSVKDLLADGWLLAGGVSISFIDNEGVQRNRIIIYAQALRKVI